MTLAQKQHLLRLGLITLLMIVVYGNTLNHGFVWDDIDIIVNNPLLEKLGNIPQLFLSEDKVSTATGYYRPLTYISFALDRAIWGLNPLGFNITNLLLQIIAALLFYAVVLALFNKERLAFIAALIFALHPLAGETVNFHAGGRNTLLSACFALLSLLFYLKERRLLAAVFLTMAIFSKEFALLLPLVFLFYDYRLAQKKVRFGDYIPYIIPVVCYLALRSYAVQNANFLESFSFSKQLWLTPYLVVRYLLNMIYPFGLKVMYDESTSISICILSLAIVILLTGAIFFFRRARELPFSAYWFLLFLLPVINLVPLHSNTLIADRYAYFSLMGFALALAVIICKANTRVMTVTVVTVCLVYSSIDFGHNRIWKDDASLFARMTEDAPEMFIGYRNLGLHYYNTGDRPNAEHYLALACSKPDIPSSYLVGAASIFMEANKLDKAEALLLKAIKREPVNPEPYLLLQSIYGQKGNKALADSYLVKAREAIPGLEQERSRMAEDFCHEGEKFIVERKYNNAKNILWRALLVKPDFVPALVAMGRLGFEQGDFAYATRYLEKAIGFDPSNISARDYLSRVQQIQGKPLELKRK